MAPRQPDIVEIELVNIKQRMQKPPMYRVLLYNDDFTTKDFVVDLLVNVFHKGPAEATVLMYEIHNKGRGVVGIYTREIAETKVSTGKEMAREHGFPLKLEMEPEE